MKKALNILKNIFICLLVIAAAGMMLFTVVSVSTFDRNDRDIFGYKVYIVRSDSMNSVNGDLEKGYFKAGDLIFVKKIDPQDLKAGDIISYTSTNAENFGETVTHMIKQKTTDANGEAGFITYGTSTGAEDANVVTHSYVLGKYWGHIAGIGTFFTFLKTTPGYIVCIFLPFLMLILIQGYNSIKLFKKYKQEQMDEMEAQREREHAELRAERKIIEEERKKQEEMMQKLLLMQAQMHGDKASSPQAPQNENNE